MKTVYVTDDFSSLGGLGAVAYGDPEYFREVQNQVWAASPTRFTDIHRPSDILESLIGTESELVDGVLEVLEAEYEKDGEFTDYVDITQGQNWKEKVAKDFFPALGQIVDSESSYIASTSGYLNKTLTSILPGFVSSENFASKIVDWLEESRISPISTNLAGAIIANNPQTKISSPPTNAKIALSNNVDLGLDYRGVEFAKGYSTLQEYWGDIPYPGMESPSILPGSLRQSVLQGYMGYASTTPLEKLYNPIAADSVGSLNLSSPEAINYSNPFTAGSILGEIPDFKRQDGDIYSISLIGETINGYTSFDPATMSNGDAIDRSLIPDYEGQNADPDGGKAGLSRTFTPPF